MKIAEKMFMAINNVDERLIDEAKGKDEKPVLVQVEKHLPIKEIIGFAACFVLLAAGIFAMFKFRINTVEVDSNVNPNITNSSESDPDDPDSPENMELRAILKDLTANAMELDGIFTRLSDLGTEHYMMKFDGDYYSHDFCYPIGDDRKTEPLGLFTVPQTQVELEQLLLTCFTEHSAKSYMDNVTTGRITTNDEEETIIIADPCSGSARVKLIETGGKMYRESFDYCIKLDIDYTTAMVTSKTDKTIKFTYWHTDGTVSDTEGVLVLENGAWKFDYFFDAGFIPITPTEFTEEDEELHDILNELSAGDTLYWWFFHGTSHGKEYMFRNSYYPNGQYVYALLPKGKKDPDSGLEYPQSCEQLEELLLKYFTRENTDKFMENAAEGTMSENSDETYTVTTDTKGKYLPIFIEIDGNMYVWRRDSGGAASIWDSAKITERTDDSIKFTMVFSAAGYYYTEDCLITYERGGWKLNYDWDTFPGENTEPTKEDAELREILRDLAANAMELDGIFTRLTDLGDEYYMMKFDGDTDYLCEYCPIDDNRKTEPLGLFTVPRTRNELKLLLLTCFSERSAEYYMDNTTTGRITANDEGTPIIIADPCNGGAKTRLIEIGGKMYGYHPVEYDIKLDIDYKTAMVTSKTDKVIKFTYSHTDGTVSDTEGVLVYENGTWKFDYFYNIGFIPVLPTEFTDEDRELQGILNELSASISVYSWFFHGIILDHDLNFRVKGNKILESDSPVNSFMYVLLPKEKNYYGIEYPQTCEQVEELLLKYFTGETTDEFMTAVGKGTMTENSDGTYTVIAENKDRPIFIEIDGNMYLWDRPSGGPDLPIWNTAKITERTDDTIKFSMIYNIYYEFYASDGIIKYERGGWKLEQEFKVLGIEE